MHSIGAELIYFGSYSFDMRLISGIYKELKILNTKRTVIFCVMKIEFRVLCMLSMHSTTELPLQSLVIIFVVRMINNIDRTIMSPFCESAKMAALPLNSHALRQPHPYQRLLHMY
jgi:hypothetical protein